MYVGDDDREVSLCTPTSRLQDVITSLQALTVPKRSFLLRAPNVIALASAMQRLLAHPLQRIDPNAMHISIDQVRTDPSSDPCAATPELERRHRALAGRDRTGVRQVMVVTASPCRVQQPTRLGCSLRRFAIIAGSKKRANIGK